MKLAEVKKTNETSAVANGRSATITQAAFSMPAGVSAIASGRLSPAGFSLPAVDAGAEAV